MTHQSNRVIRGITLLIGFPDDQAMEASPMLPEKVLGRIPEKGSHVINLVINGLN